MDNMFWRRLYTAAPQENYLSLALFQGGCCWQHLISLSEYHRLPLKWELQYNVFVGAPLLALYLKALKAEVTPRQRKKTFIVYECGVTQDLSEKNKEVRSWFEVSEIILPSLFSFDRAVGLWNCSHQEQSAHSCKSDTLQLQRTV